MPEDAIPKAIERISAMLSTRLEELQGQGKLLEAERLKSRTEYDIEMLKEMGHCPGIENYSAPIANRQPGELCTKEIAPESKTLWTSVSVFLVRWIIDR